MHRYEKSRVRVFRIEPTTQYGLLHGPRGTMSAVCMSQGNNPLSNGNISACSSRRYETYLFLTAGMDALGPSGIQITAQISVTQSDDRVVIFFPENRGPVPPCIIIIIVNFNCTIAHRRTHIRKPEICCFCSDAPRAKGGRIWGGRLLCAFRA